MKGIKHKIAVLQPNDGLEPDYGLTGPAVEMANEDDPYYTQVFENWQEVDEFVAELRSRAEEAFGPRDKGMRGIDPTKFPVNEAET